MKSTPELPMPANPSSHKKPRFRTVAAPPPHLGHFHAYVLQCADGSYFVGYSHDVQASVDQHLRAFGVCPSAAKRLAHLIMTEGPYPEAMAAARASGLLSQSAYPSFPDFVRMHVWLECR